MMTILNRLRGTWSWVAKLVGVIFGLLVFFATGNYYVSTACAIGYVVGESMGWGAWLGGLISGQSVLDDEGDKNGIAWLAGKISPPISVNLSFAESVFRYNVTALVIRGFYWWIPALAPLFFVSDPWEILASIILLSTLFPVTAWIANSTKFTFGWFVPDAWGRSEIFYGLFQDLVFIVVFSHIALNWSI